MESKQLILQERVDLTYLVCFVATAAPSKTNDSTALWFDSVIGPALGQEGLVVYRLMWAWGAGLMIAADLDLLQVFKGRRASAKFCW
jgi:hypothetical protein